jgi:hypothetical protein
MMINRNHEEVIRKLDRNGIDPGIFYGNTNTTYNFQSDTIPQPIFPLQSTLCGPSTAWNIFKKQQDVLDFVAGSNLELLPFTYQNGDGNRLFVAAHPKNFWYKDEQKKPEERHSYEIIQERRACKLYFDLEFEPHANKNHRGDRMVSTFIVLVCTALQSKYGIKCGCNDVLILDSSSSTKFSCHLIFPNVVFENNIHVGYFVKHLCNEIRLVGIASNLSLLKNVQSCEEINELSVLDAKNRRKFFCDEAVYTKNRHFRLYKSSKFGKNVPLKVSELNQLEICETESRELNTFLCSLITYCSQTARRLIYECDFADKLTPVSISPSAIRPNRKNCEAASNPFVEIDRCVSDIVRPGSIYRSRYYPEKRVLVYDIVGNRYCGNIGRQHKSNNVKYIVDVNTLSYYQKCYDPDCADFKSTSRKLPVDESIFLNHDIDDRDFLLLPESDFIPRETYSSYRETAFSSSEEEEEDLIEAAERCEFLNRSRGKLLFFQDADDDLMIHAAEECEKSHAYDANDDQLMISVAEECEAMVLNGKRKFSEHFADEDSSRMLTDPTKNDDDDDKCRRDKRKMIRADGLSSR